MPEGERVFLIADLAGSTALTEAMGSHEAATVIGRYVALAEASLRPPALLVERVGDEVLIVSADSLSAVETAVALRDAIEREPLFPSVRIGLDAGIVLEQAGRYFGSALNLTARVAAYARAGQILCTERIAQTATLPGVEYHALGAMRFRNVADEIRIFEVVDRPQRPSVAAIDPVCRMNVLPGVAPAQLPFGGVTYYFCSFDCARLFAERPEAYRTD